MTGSRSRRMIAWDSCLFLGWFNQEQDKPLADMEQILTLVANGELSMLVSAVCVTEVLDTLNVVDGVERTSDAGQQMIRFLKRSNVVPAAVDLRIAQRAAEFRQRAKAALIAGRTGKSIKAPDAIVAATAVTYGASELHSFDPTLLSFSRTDIIGGLVVTRDLSADRQGRLF